MRIALTSLLVSLFLLGCAAQTPTQVSKATDSSNDRGRCDTVLTGSRIPQCNRGDVNVITRDEIERNPTWLHNPDPYGDSRPGNR